MTEENVNLSLSNDESIVDTNISFDGNVDITTSSPLPAVETEQISAQVTTQDIEEAGEKTKFRKSLEDFSSEVSAVVFSNMSDRDAFALCRKLFRELRMQKQGYFPIKNRRKERVKLKSKRRKGLLKGNKKAKK